MPYNTHPKTRNHPRTTPTNNSSKYSHVQLSTPTTLSDAQTPQYVAFLFRAPYALDAYQLGFATGIREDYKLQQEKYDSLNIPVYMLDNYFKNPNLDRYLNVCRTHSPRVGVIGDAFTPADAQTLVATATKLRNEFEYFEPIIVPKCGAALDIIPNDIIVGYANGYSDLKPPDFSTLDDWHGRHVHILGGTPPKTFEILQLLTHGRVSTPLDNPATSPPTLSDFDTQNKHSQLPVSQLSHTPANIVGIDWNGLHQWAMKGDYWHHDGNPWWRNADNMTVRASVRTGLQHIKQYWKTRNIWPTTTPINDPLFEPALSPPPHANAPVCAGCGTNTWDSTSNITVIEYEDGVTRAFCSQMCRDRLEYYDGAIPLSIAQRDIQYLLDRPRAAWVSPA